MAVTEIEQIDAIGTDDSKNLKLLIVDVLDWIYEYMHLDILKDKIKNYILYINKKQYSKEYGDDHSKYIIEIHFQYGITQNAMDVLDVISSQINNDNIFFDIHLPEEKS